MNAFETSPWRLVPFIADLFSLEYLQLLIKGLKGFYEWSSHRCSKSAPML